MPNLSQPPFFEYSTKYSYVVKITIYGTSLPPCAKMSRNISVGMEKYGVVFRTLVKTFPSLQLSQRFWGTVILLCDGYRGISWMVTLLVSRAAHSYSCSTEFKNSSLCTCTIGYIFIRDEIVVNHREKDVLYK